MTTALRFASVVGGVGGLILLAAIILSANDRLPSPPGDDHRIAIHVSAPPPVPTAQPGADAGPPTAPAATVPTSPPAGPMPLAATTNAPAAQAMVSRGGPGERQAGQHAGDHGDRDGEGR